MEKNKNLHYSISYHKSYSVTEIAKLFCEQHKRKMYLAEKFPELKFDEVELLSELVTDNEIEEYEKELGN